MTLLGDVDKTWSGRMLDVDFERSIRVLAETWGSFPAAAAGEDDFHRLCRALREGKLRFADVDRWYGTGYDASVLRALTRDIGQTLPRVLRSRYGSSIRRHLREIACLFKRRDSRSTRNNAIYASSVA